MDKLNEERNVTDSPFQATEVQKTLLFLNYRNYCPNRMGELITNDLVLQKNHVSSKRATGNQISTTE